MKSKPRHSWKRAPGGWSCKKCGMFLSEDRVFFPVKGAAVTERENGGTPPCVKTEAKA